MKTLLTSILLWGPFLLLAQVPQQFSYQGIARDPNGLPVDNQNISLQIQILENAANGSAVYIEDHLNLQTNSFGLFNINIGGGVVVSGSFSAINWGVNTYFLSISIDINGGNNFSFLGTTQLLAVPYALYAAASGTSTSDFDTDPENELQFLTVQGNELSILNPDGSASNSVDLPQIWTQSGNNISYDNGDVFVNQDLFINGSLTVRDNSGNNLFRVTNNGNFGGRMEVYNGDGNIMTAITTDILGEGRLFTFGPNGSVNSRLIRSSNNNANLGSVEVVDGSGSPAAQAAIRVNAAGQGEIFADVKNFRMDHPEDTDSEIWYASLEGPEAGAYERGTAQLIDGKAIIQFSDHFQLVAESQSMTVSLTPLAAESKGLAVIEKNNTGFIVQELFHGEGNYEFDWEVKCIRKGFENYQVIRPKENYEEKR